MFTNKKFQLFMGAKTEIRNYFELSSLMNTDFQIAKRVVQLNTEEIEIQSLNQNVEYELNENYVLRKVNNHVDTFFCNVSHSEVHTFNELEEFPVVDYLKLTIADEGGDKVLSFYKSYGAEILMNEINYGD